MTNEQEQTTRLLARTLVHGAEVLAHLKHPHLARTLQDALESLLRTACSDTSDHVAIAADAIQLRSCLEDISIVSGAPLGALLLAERHVLLLHLHITTERVHTARTVSASRQASVTSGREPHEQMRVTPSMRESMEQVLAFVRSSGAVQARDIIAGCSPKLSERTVKRRIKDLVQDGKLHKDDQNGVLLYRVT